MSEIKEYKCPACGGAMEFDSKSQKMKCPYCDTEISVDEYESLIAKADQVVAADACIRCRDRTEEVRKLYCT